jgi:hypothetical protein
VNDPRMPMQLDTDNSAEPPCHDFLCGGCSSQLVQPVEWTRSGDTQWVVLLRCPDCFQYCELVLDDAHAHEFSQAMDEATRSLLEVAEFLERDIFRQRCETFIKALRADHISPMDF